MGAVYAAEDSKLGRKVAVKVLPPELADDPERLARFQREARAVAALNHPNIVVLHSVEEADGVHFLTMELVDGQPLSELVPIGGMETGRLIELAVPMTEALAAAHDRGIAHRDLKPANIMVNREGRVKVLDFGLAKLADPAPDTQADTQTPTEDLLTQEGRILGTTAYMSPEQLQGRAVDGPSDIFSLGIVLYEMATGRRPFRGDSAVTTIAAILNETPPVPSSICERIPTALDAVIARCLEKDPADRFASMSELREALRLSAESPTTPASGPGVGRWVAAAVGILALVFIVYLLRTPGGEPDPPPAETTADISRGPSIAVLPFENASGDPDQAYFSSGLTEALITELSRFQDLTVIARSSTDRYAGPVDISSVGEALDVRYVLQGSVQKVGDDVRITARLSDTVGGEQFWAESYTRSLTASDVFSLQDEVAIEVVDEIANSYGAIFRDRLAEARSKPPTNLSSYDCVLHAFDYLQIHSPAKHLAARECLERAVAADPDYAETKGWLAYFYAEEYHHRWNARPEEYDALSRALPLAEEAVHMDNANQAAHGSLALVLFFTGDYERAMVEAQRTVELNPRNALWLALMGVYSTQIGELDIGLAMMHEAEHLSPHPPAWFSMGFFYDDYLNGRYEDALAEAHQLDMAGDFRTAMFRAAAYGQLRRLDEATGALEEFFELWNLPLEGLRDELIERHAFSPDLVDALLEGLVKAGIDDVWGIA